MLAWKLLMFMDHTIYMPVYIGVQHAAHARLLLWQLQQHQMVTMISWDDSINNEHNLTLQPADAATAAATDVDDCNKTRPQTDRFNVPFVTVKHDNITRYFDYDMWLSARSTTSTCRLSVGRQVVQRDVKMWWICCRLSMCYERTYRELLRNPQQVEASGVWARDVHENGKDRDPNNSHGNGNKIGIRIKTLEWGKSHCTL